MRYSLKAKKDPGGYPSGSNNYSLSVSGSLSGVLTLSASLALEEADLFFLTKTF